MLALSRGWSGATTPLNVRSGNASTVNVTAWPGLMLLMSASLTDAQTWRRLRSLASRNRLGAFRLDTTVWPMFTRRSTMTPLTGATMVQYRRLVSAFWSDALDDASVAWALRTLASASCRAAWFWATVAWPTASAALATR